MLARNPIPSFFALFALGAGVMYLSGQGRADTVDDWFEKHHGYLLAKTSGRVPEPSLYAPVELHATLFPGEDGQGPTGNLDITPNNLRLDKRYSSTDVTHGQVWTGAIVPVVGRLFRASVHRNADGGGYISLHLLAEKQLPPGISFRKDSLLLPSPVASQHPMTALVATSGIKGAASFIDGLRVYAIEEKDGKVMASIGGGYSGKWPQVAVKVGDYLQLGDVGHEVRAIVPRDRKKNLIGWVELGGEPVPVAKLRERKATVVNPRPKDDEPGSPGRPTELPSGPGNQPRR